MTKMMSLEESMKLDSDPSTSHSYWRAALEGRILPTHRYYVPQGWFRSRRKDGTYEPVTIHMPAGEKKRAEFGKGRYLKVFETAEHEGAFADETFAFIAKDAITYEAYLHWYQTGEWPASEGALALIEESRKARPRAAKKVESAANPVAATEPGIGHNSGEDPAVEFEIFVDQVAAALKGVDGLKAVETDEQVASALSLANRLTELSGQGDKLRVAEKAPHLAATKAVDARWKPTIDDAAGGARTLKNAINALKTKQLREKREREAAQAALANPATEAAPPERIIAPYGNSSTVKTRKQVKVVDYDAVYQALRANADVRALLDKLAQRVIDAGGTIAGVEIEEVARIR